MGWWGRGWNRWAGLSVFFVVLRKKKQEDDSDY